MKKCRICGRETSDNDLNEKDICTQCQSGDSLAENILRHPELVQLREDLNKIANTPLSGLAGKLLGGNGGQKADEAHRKLGEIIQLATAAEKGISEAREKLDGMGIGKKAMQEDTPSEGGYLVPVEHLAELLRLPDTAYMEPLIRIIPMLHKTKNIPDLNTTVTGGWTDEEGLLTEGSPVLGICELTAKKWGIWVPVSNELIADAAPDVQTMLGELVEEAVGTELDAQIFGGTGVPCSGLLTAACGYSVVMGTGSVNFSSITADVLSDMIPKVKASVLPGARWIWSPDVAGYIRKLKDDNNRPLWDLSSGPGGTVWGYPVTTSDQMPGEAESGADTAFVIFGNPRYFILGVRSYLTIAVDPYGLLTNDQTRVRWTRRIAPIIAKAKAWVRLLTPST